MTSFRPILVTFAGLKTWAPFGESKGHFEEAGINTYIYITWWFFHFIGFEPGFSFYKPVCPIKWKTNTYPNIRGGFKFIYTLHCLKRFKNFRAPDVSFSMANSANFFRFDFIVSEAMGENGASVNLPFPPKVPLRPAIKPLFLRKGYGRRVG